MTSKRIKFLLAASLISAGSAITGKAALTITSSDTWASASGPAGGLLLGTSGGVLLNYQSSSPKTLFLDLTEASARFEWRQNGASTPLKSKMRLDETNTLSLFNAAGNATISLQGSTGVISTVHLSATSISGNSISVASVSAGSISSTGAISAPSISAPSYNLSGTGSGIFLGGNSVFTLDAAGKVNYGSLRPIGIASILDATSSTSAALTVGGGIWAGKDSFFNGVRVGRGAGSQSYNTALGASALTANTTGNFNTAAGALALTSNLSGSWNAAFGDHVMNFNTTGSNNTGVGSYALLYSNGSSNTAVGYSALYSYAVGTPIQTGSNNSAFGLNSLYYNTSGGWNTAIGTNSMQRNTTGIANVAIGNEAGMYYGTGPSELLTSPDYSVYIGHDSRALSDSDFNSIVIGANSRGKGANTTVLGNVNTTDTHLFGKTHSGGLVVSEATAVAADVSNANNVVVVGNGVPGTPQTAFTVEKAGEVKFKSSVRVPGKLLVNANGVFVAPSAGDLSMGDFIAAPGENTP